MTVRILSHHRVSLADAMDALARHDWVGEPPDITAEQMAELLPVLAVLFADVKPKRERRKPDRKVSSEGRARRLVSQRSGGLCEACGKAPAAEWHHRKPRSQGGLWTAANGLHLCSPCHLWVTEHPELACLSGLSVKSYNDPTGEPVHRRGVRVYLDDDGGLRPAGGGAA